MEQLRAKKGYICDMDGVIYWGGRLLPGVKEFVDGPVMSKFVPMSFAPLRTKVTALQIVSS